MAPTKKLEGKVAIVTGSSSGIGEGIAIRFAKEGANVSLTGRNKAELERVAAACKEHGVKAITTAGDIASDVLRKKLVDHTLTNFGKIDILVNNAGLTAPAGDILDLNYETFDLIHNVNLRAVYHLTGLCAPHIVKTKGNIINISSVAGFRTIPTAMPYCISKAGLDMLTRCLAAELAPHQVRVNGVNPAAFSTNIGRDYPKEKYEAVMAGAAGQHALGRIGEIPELVNFVTFLASDEASFMTGINCPCDGGYLVK